MTKSLLNISDLSRDQLFQIIKPAQDNDVLKGKSIGMLFENYSTRTRLSFSKGINQLGGNVIDIKFEEMNYSRNESYEDTFRTFNCYLDGLIYRTTNHNNFLTIKNFFHKPVINALSNLSHPCQTISDLYTLFERFGTLDLNILWMGDMNNVCFSLVEAANLIKEINLIICCPKIISSTIEWKLNSNVKVIDNYLDIDLSVIDCVMTDVFVSMNDIENNEKIKSLNLFKVDIKVMQETKDECVFMHCLPANIGSEVTEDVINGSKSIVWKQAYNRNLAQKKLMQFINWN